MFCLAKSARLMAVAAVGGAAVLGLAVCGSATAWGDPSTLMSMLPQGFSSSNCKEVPPKGHAVERVDCDASSESGGPSAASFGLYTNLDDLNAGFQNAKITLSSTCPGNQVSPGPWGYGTGEKNGGQVECGTVEGDSNTTVAVVVWTDKAKLRAAAIQGSDIASLYQWWKTKSG
jgi:hypothetical protein